MVKNPPASAGNPEEVGSIPESGRSLEKEMVSHSSILAWKSHGERSLVGYSPWGHKESDTIEHTNKLRLRGVMGGESVHTHK